MGKVAESVAMEIATGDVIAVESVLGVMGMLRETIGNLKTRDCVMVTVVVTFRDVVIVSYPVVVVVILRTVVINVCLVIVECVRVL